VNITYIPTLANFSFVPKLVKSDKSKKKHIPPIIPYTVVYVDLAVPYSPFFKCLAKSLEAVIAQRRQWSLSA
jgi:hypothetical protein